MVGQTDIVITGGGVAMPCRLYHRKGDIKMAEYSFTPVQTVVVDGNVLFANGSRACRKGFVQHRDDSGIFFLRGATNQCKAVYRVTFDANVAVAPADDGGVLEPVSLALTINGEPLGNATAVVTPGAIGDFFAISRTTFVEVPCSCCVTISVENTSETTAVDVSNANIVIERVA